MKKSKDKLDELNLNERQKHFCREYIYDWNATRAYKAAYPDVKKDNSAAASAITLLRNTNIQSYIEEIQQDLEKLTGLSRQKVINEHIKLAFSSIAHLHNTWIERKEFERLTDDQKACIQEISTKTQQRTEWEWDETEKKKIPHKIDVEYIKIKLYDKQKSLDAINRMLGYDSASVTEIRGIPRPLNINVDSEKTAEILKLLRSGSKSD